MSETTSVCPVLLSVSDLADLLATSPRTIHRLNAVGAIPTPVRIGSRPRWRREEIERWITAGCPNRAEWERQN